MPSPLPLDTYLDALRRDGQALADAAERAGLDVEVAHCPGWRVADLVWHVGEVHDFWRSIVEQQAADPGEVPQELARPADDDLVAWFRDGVERLHAALAAAAPSTAVWTWSPQKDVAFVQRRMAQETSVHRWDAETAAGADHAVDRDLAVDGIDEFLRIFVTDGREDAEPLGGTVHLHCTDAEGEWLIGDGPDGGLDVSEGHAKGDAAARGSASDLLLLLWRRRSPVEVDVFGDGRVLDRLLAHTNLE